MRVWVYILLFLFASLAHAADVDIKTSTEDKETVYLLHVAAYSTQKQADDLKIKLERIVNVPVEIEYLNEKKLYLVKVGPIKNLANAQSLKTKIESTLHSSPKQSSSTVWNLRNADIRAVIAEVSRITGKNFLIDPRVQGKITIVSSQPMNEKELYQVFLSMLQISGYAAIPSGEVIKIVPNIEAKTLSPDLLSQMRKPPQGDDMMVQVIPVKYVPAEQLVPVLRPLMPQWSSVSAYAPSNMLILSGRANNIRQMAEIINQVDSSNASGIDMVPLRHALAMDIANTLKDLIKTQPGIMHSQTMIAADDRNNAILISGNKTERIRLRLLISQLDKPGPYGNDSNTQVIYLSYARAEDLVPILAGIAQASFSGLVGTTIGTITRPVLDSTNPAASMGANALSAVSPPPVPSTPVAPIAPGALPTTTATATQIEGTTKPSVQIIAEPNTNSIIINAPPTLIRTLKSVISQLDIKPAQILIEALVAEINESDVLNLGIEWGSVITDSATDTSTFRPGFAILNSHTSLDQFQAQIYALAREKKANILSTPSVVVLDNRQAKILIGKQLSVATSSYPNNAGGTTTASPFTTFDRINVALHLYVRPQITRDNGIQMQIDQGNDTLDPVSAADASTNPIFNISAIVTSVHVDSGDIIVLGGLIQDSLGNDDNRLPILGDIPGVGKLFQHNITSREKKVLMVFIRPFILKTRDQYLQVTGTKYHQTRDIQLEMVRTQDYNEHDMNTVLPPWKNTSLPTPFCKPPCKTAAVIPPKSQFMTK
ncbi:GspD family T2SS secretin variant LspD [Legionella impletisoli]|uniref:Type II protein secretion LspD n=1 Tax=Legionella impletisoli TaxID=343510 RepID=A0A917NA47_9GAMM|nr:GspD family T2SS secretin variant LspD [Legionella impletisoli]GGI80766.1 type II protein secretion LspD [Legionella impletisoli]